jgi:hypothetical protein
VRCYFDKSVSRQTESTVKTPSDCGVPKRLHRQKSAGIIMVAGRT